MWEAFGLDRVPENQAIVSRTFLAYRKGGNDRWLSVGRPDGTDLTCIPGICASSPVVYPLLPSQLEERCSETGF